MLLAMAGEKAWSQASLCFIFGDTLCVFIFGDNEGNLVLYLDEITSDVKGAHPRIMIVWPAAARKDTLVNDDDEGGKKTIMLVMAKTGITTTM